MANLGSPAEIIGKNDFELPWTEEEAIGYRQCDRQVIEQNQPELNIIETVTRADGTKRWLDTSKVPLLDGNGTVIGILGTFSDITDRKKNEIELYRSQKKLQRQVEQERLLYQLSMQIRSSIGTSETLQHTIEMALHSLRTLLKVDRVSFCLVCERLAPLCWEVVSESRREELPSVIGRYPIEEPGLLLQSLRNLQVFSH